MEARDEVLTSSFPEDFPRGLPTEPNVSPSGHITRLFKVRAERGPVINHLKRREGLGCGHSHAVSLLQDWSESRLPTP